MRVVFNDTCRKNPQILQQHLTNIFLSNASLQDFHIGYITLLNLLSRDTPILQGPEVITNIRFQLRIMYFYYTFSLQYQKG
jgi:hypothetical protein